MAYPRQFTRPMVCAAASFQGDQALRLIRKKLEDLPTRYSATEELLPSRICAMRLKDILRDIQTNRANFTHGRLLS
jgi:hypothetical protein